MNQLKAYEITVKGKLEAIPLPDMQDAIWARIEAQLDTDMPTDDDNNKPFDPPTGPLILGSSILAFLITLLTLYFAQNNSDNFSSGTNDQDLEPTTNQNTVSPESAGSPQRAIQEAPFLAPSNSTGDIKDNDPLSVQEEGIVGPNVKGDSSSFPDLQNARQNLLPGVNGSQSFVSGTNDLRNNIEEDKSVNPSPPGIQVPKDQSQIENGKLNKAPSKDSIPTGKKSRGVKGVTDNDYRIVPKKDN